MKNTYKHVIVAVMTLAGVVFSTSAVMADGVTPTPTRTPTPTVTPKEETRVECTTGSYGQQTCKTVVVKTTPEATPKHEVVNSGMQENVIALLLAAFAVSAFGYGYAKVRV